MYLFVLTSLPLSLFLVLDLANLIPTDKEEPNENDIDPDRNTVDTPDDVNSVIEIPLVETPPPKTTRARVRFIQNIFINSIYNIVGQIFEAVFFAIYIHPKIFAILR